MTTKVSKAAMHQDFAILFAGICIDCLYWEDQYKVSSQLQAIAAACGNVEITKKLEAKAARDNVHKATNENLLQSMVSIIQTLRCLEQLDINLVRDLMQEHLPEDTGNSMHKAIKNFIMSLYDKVVIRTQPIMEEGFSADLSKYTAPTDGDE